MKRYLLFFISALFVAVLTQDAYAQKATFGYLSYDKLLRSMSDYTAAQNATKSLREQYEKEAQYNEDRFFKMYAEYIQGQKTFPLDIMLKRQKELQVAMDEGIKFRSDAEKLLSQAEAEMLRPIEAKLDSAIAQVARQYSLSFVANTDNHAYPFVSNYDGMDISIFVEMVLAGKPLPKIVPAQIEMPDSAPAAAPAAQSAAPTAQPAAASAQQATIEQQLTPLLEAK